MQLRFREVPLLIFQIIRVVRRSRIGNDDKVLERAVRSEPHPKIHIIPIQSTPARKHSPIPGSMALN